MNFTHLRSCVNSIKVLSGHYIWLALLLTISSFNLFLLLVVVVSLRCFVYSSNFATFSLQDIGL